MAMFAVWVAAVLLSAALVRRMIRVAVMDVPGERSAHDRPTPRGGGVGMVAAVLLGVPVCVWLLGGGRWAACGLLLASVAMLAVVSWLDDVRQFGFVAKLGAQCVSSAAMVCAAVLAAPVLPGWWTVPLGFAGFCWLMLTTNAMNFIDGLNGLASGVSAVCGGFAALLGVVFGDALLVGAGLMLTAGLLGFLPFNMPRGRIFMGDVGSQVCGLLTGGFALLLLADSGRVTVALAVPLILAGVLWDVLFTLARRLWAGERVTQAHRGHLYQVVSRSGVTPVTVAVTHWGFALWGGAVGLVVLPGRPVVAMAMVLLPQLSWSLVVRLLARRSGLGRWS